MGYHQRRRNSHGSNQRRGQMQTAFTWTQTREQYRTPDGGSLSPRGISPSSFLKSGCLSPIVICWVYLHFRFSLMVPAAYVSSFVCFSSLFLLSRNHINRPVFDLKIFRVYYCLRPISSFIRLYEIAPYYSNVHHQLAHPFDFLFVCHGTCLCTFKEWLGDGVTTGGVVPHFSVGTFRPACVCVCVYVSL